MGCHVPRLSQLGSDHDENSAPKPKALVAETIWGTVRIVRFAVRGSASVGIALNRALYNYMHGIGLDEDARFWFDEPVPETTVAPDFIATALDG
jgi:hypothetical protein